MSRDQTHVSHLLRRLRWDEIDPAWLRRLITEARLEDTAGLGLANPPARAGDATTEVLPPPAVSASARAALVARSECIVCGGPLLPLILDDYAAALRRPAPVVKDAAPEGARMRRGETIAILDGDAAVLLTAERVLLNFLQKLTGIATITAAYAAALDGSGARLLDTRKTTPGWRMLEKYAVATGGGWNHRLGLFDRVMLKDNHLAAGGATAGERLAILVRRARELRPDLPVQCEVDDISQIPPVLEAGADVILLDNFRGGALRDALALARGRVWTEVSGGITLETLPAIAALGPDFISTGAVTHRAPWADIGLDWE